MGCQHGAVVSGEELVASKRQRCEASLSTSTPVTLCLKGFNIQWPFSQLILLGAKRDEIRKYDLDRPGYPCKNEEVWLVETHGLPVKHAIVGDLPIAPRPSAAQIIGTVTFADAHEYDSKTTFHEHRQRHCIAEGSQHDWDGCAERYCWRVAKVRALATPVPVQTGQTGFSKRHSSASQTVVFA